ncbi:hypothetical protein [Bacillus paranthracis]|uniref:hypothetical protein n=1 Tax=Bacillus paranthracis TaxID=2026186 RepID=UPI003D22A56F
MSDQKKEFKNELLDKMKINHSNGTVVNLDENTRKAIETFIDTGRVVREAMQPTIQSLAKTIPLIIETRNKFIESMKPVFEMIEQVSRAVTEIDWEQIRQDRVEYLKEIDKKLKEYENEFWCLDLMTYSDMVDQGISIDTIPKYIENNLESCIEDIVSDPIYEHHASLIIEAYQAYKVGLYKVCAFPLLATFERIIASWYVGNVREDKIEIKKTRKVKRLYNEIDPDMYKSVDQELMFEMFSLSVLRTFKKLFITASKPYQELNRHSIAHGFHDYEHLAKIDILKLFQLLKAATLLRFLDSKKVKDKTPVEA